MKKNKTYRRPAGNRVQWLKVLSLIIPILALSGFGFHMLWHAALGWVEESSLAVLKEVEIKGTSLVTEHDVLEAAAVPLGANIMQLPLDSIAIRVTALERIEIARAIRRLPGRLILKIYEREPIGALADGELMLTDANGVVFNPVYGLEKIDLPIITGNKTGADEIGLQTAIDLLVSIKSKYPVLYDNIGEISVHKGTIDFMRLRQGGAMVKVEKEITEEALNGLNLFLEQKVTELSPNTQYVDLSMPGMVITGHEPG